MVLKKLVPQILEKNNLSLKNGNLKQREEGVHHPKIKKKANELIKINYKFKLS